MIAHLVIGRARRELFVSGDAHPAEIQAFLRRLHRDRREVTCATWSPVVIDEVLRLWQDGDGGPGPYGRILLRGSGPANDTPLSAAKDPGWLAHFSIGDLLARGELDAWLDIDPRLDDGK